MLRGLWLGRLATQQHTGARLSAGGFHAFSIPIPSHFRLAIPVPKLHYVHSHSLGIFTGKWETRIPILYSADLYFLGVSAVDAANNSR